MIHTATISDASLVAHKVVAIENGVRACDVRSVATMNCDRIAPFYRWLEYLSFGGALQVCRSMYLADIADCRRALVCGDGDGRFLAELLRANRRVRVDFCDLSAGMAGIARKKVEAIGAEAVARTNFHVGDARDFIASDGVPFDLITAHFFLDCFDDGEVTSVTSRLASLARPGAALLLSDFRIPPRSVAHYVAAAIVRGLYGAFRLTTGLRVTRLPDYENALARAGFHKHHETLRLRGLLVASLWQKI